MLVNEEFTSIQGEGPSSGRVTYFIRTAGCNLRCNYCDTIYAQDKSSGYVAQISSLVSRVIDSQASYVCITGGEPLLQAASTLILIKKLVAKKPSINIVLETNGEVIIPSALFTQGLQVQVVMDIKTPGSGNKNIRIYKENLPKLRDTGVVKFVVTSLDDMAFVREVLQLYRKFLPPVYISPVWGDKKLMQDVAALMVKDSAFRHCILQTQLHKVIWGSKRRRV
ncbi:MAG: 7-carboxy-7-deazaguanine synthase QueE [Candidatus Heimdallarchaeaceae archaeon]